MFVMQGQIEPTRLSLAYRCGMLVVAVAMLLLPLIYIAAMASVAYSIWWHLTANAGILDGRGGTQWRLIAYLAPAIVGTIVLFFMVKPLLARRVKSRDPLEVTNDEAPLLFALIEQICDQVRARRPRRVYVDCQVNASAGLLHGVLGRDLVLTIGLPLAAGLSVRELAGVLAHEFGHFAQGGGMRLTGIVRGINAWFARVVYERDAWDVRLEEWTKRTDWRLAAVLAIARGAVWMSRRILMGLMYTGHAISCFMMRQMEYDADSYEVKFAGRDAFARTSTRLRELGLASQFAYRDLRDSVSAGAAPTNLPVYVAGGVARVPSELREHLVNGSAEKTGLFDTHPSDADRLRAAGSIDTPGVLLGGDLPASALFADFEALCANATRLHYEHDLGLDPDQLTLVANDVAAMRADEQQERRRAIQAFFGGNVSALRPIQLVAPPDEPFAAARRGRERMRALIDLHLPSQYRRVEELERRRIDAFAAQALLDAGFTINAAEFGLSAGTHEEAASMLESLRKQTAVLANTLDPFDQAAGERLAAGLAADAAAAGRAPDTAITTTMNALASAVPHLIDLRLLTNAAVLLDANASNSSDAARVQRCLTRIGSRIEERLRSIEVALRDAHVPLQATGELVPLARFLGLSVSPSTDAAQALSDRVWGMYFDLLGRAASVALAAEDNPTAV